MSLEFIQKLKFILQNLLIMNRFFIFIVMFLLSCSQSIKKFDTKKFIDYNYEKIECVDIKKITPLKKEWPELYNYLVKGHLFVLKDHSETRFALSQNFAKYFQENRIKVYKTPFLQDLDQFKLAFCGIEETIMQNYIEYGAFAFIVDSYAIFGDLPQGGSGFSWQFDIKSRRLLAYGKINNINDWK